jgi:hypothetical protein
MCCWITRQFTAQCWAMFSLHWCFTFSQALRLHCDMAGAAEWIIESFNKYTFPSQVLGLWLMDLSEWSCYLLNVISSRFKTNSASESCITVWISSITISRKIEKCFSLCSSLRKLIVPRNSCVLQTEIHESTFWNDLWTLHSAIAQSFRPNYNLFAWCIRLARTPIWLRVRDVVDVP